MLLYSKNGCIFQTSLLLLILTAVVIPTNNLLFAQQFVPGVGKLSQYDLLLLTTPSQSQSSSSQQSVLLVDLSRRVPNKLVSLPSVTELFLRSRREEDKKNSTTTIRPTNDKSSGGCQRYDQVAAGRGGDDNRIYFSCDKGVVIGWVEGDNFGVAYSAEAPTQTSTISSLHHFNNSLYWIEDQKRIRSLSTVDKEALPEDVVITEEDDKIQGIAISASTNTLYYTVWPNYSRTNASVRAVDLLKEKLSNRSSLVIQSGLLLPKSIDVEGDGIYWIGNPPGIYFTIEMITVGDEGEEDGEGEGERRRVVMRQAHQHGGSLAVVRCGREVYWTDVVDKRVWVVRGSSSVLVGEEMLMGVGSFLAVAKGGRREGICQGEEDDDALVEGPSVLKRNMEEKGSEIRKEVMKPIAVVQNNRSSGIRMCSVGEVELIGCKDGEGRVYCVVVYGTAPMCLTRRLSSSNKTLFSTSNPVQLQQEDLTNQQSYTNWPPQLIALVSVLATVAVIMSLITVYMGVRMRSLSRKPIIRRRVVVSRKASESQGGGHGQGSNNNPASVCEMIDIENCCNMNVCETPCYERTLLPTTVPNNGSSSSSSSSPNSTTTTTTTTVISVNSSNAGWGSGGNCGGAGGAKEDKKCLLSI